MSCFINLCRLCAGKVDELLSFNVLSPDHDGLLKKMLICLPIQVSEGDNYPKYICMDCAYKIDIVFDFRERCILTAQLFEEMIAEEVRNVLEMPSSVQSDHDGISVQSVAENSKTIVVDLPGLDFGTDYLLEHSSDNSQLIPEINDSKEILLPLEELKLDLARECPNTQEPILSQEEEQQKTPPIPQESIPAAAKCNKQKQCGECGKVCQSNSKLLAHMRKHRPEKPYHCTHEQCSKSFRSKIGLAQHVAGHVGLFEFSCSTCGRGFQCKSYLKAHQRVHSTEKAYACQQCPQTFKSKQSLTDHVNRHLGVKPYLCDICGRGFITKGLCKSHQKTHTGQDNRQYPCHVCQKQFVSKSYLRIHFNIHSGKKPFICEVCGKSFLTQVDLKVHRTMHTGEKSYVCETCGKAFARRDALRCHKRLHTGERPYKCDFCGQRFSQFSPMAIHKRLHTGERPYKCIDCNKGFVSRSTLSAHRKKQHASGTLHNYI